MSIEANTCTQVQEDYDSNPMRSELYRTAPEAIFLQISDDDDHYQEPFEENEDVTWCKDSVVSCEVKYVRADVNSDLRSAMDLLHDIHCLIDDGKESGPIEGIPHESLRSCIRRMKEMGISPHPTPGSILRLGNPTDPF